MPKRKRVTRSTRSDKGEYRKLISIRVKPETAQMLASIAVETNASQGRVIDSFLKPFLKVD